MKITVRVNLYNDNLITARKEMGYTQIDIARICGTGVNVISAIERLMTPPTSVGRTKEILNTIASTLGYEFDYLFPPDYLKALENDMLIPGNGIEWSLEVPLLSARTRATVPNLSERVEHQELSEVIYSFLDELDERERFVINRRYGLDGYEPMTLEEIAYEYRKLHGYPVTRERIRQIEDTVMHRLRHPNRTRVLREYK